ncbi:hypothetical protein K432DRAFT_421693 [Lepidopterella palustris CBS 459.81]|uniref:Autophagy-related protein 2 n=1 Tax=Lepidopterella palustris CBS 459.81 TaxID=1314670 RepID=A0A8E2EKI6_9PEZI|nr:hypothetical protein K432DRAFT_421693 [Lepidopterella palustris CBS 459.81]
MAFFTSGISSLGKKSLIRLLQYIDILDKDPSDFVDVALGLWKTTLEVRDVGLRVKRLITLLNLNLPPEVDLSKARVSLLRVTLNLDLANPRIVIEFEGAQVHATLSKDKQNCHHNVEDRETAGSRSPGEEDRHLPTAEDLATSFLREEPPEEIEELEEALNTQSEYLQESTMSSEDGDDEGAVGMGTKVGLPVMLRNFITKALNNLEMIVKNIDFQIDGHLSSEPASSSPNDETSSVAVNFHIDCVSIDGLVSGDPEVDTSSVGDALPSTATNRRNGKRRMHLESICARLISDPESFASLSRVSRPSSPVDVRSDISSSQKSNSESSRSAASSGFQDDPNPDLLASRLFSNNDLDAQPSSLPFQPQQERQPLEESVLTVDEDRFADAMFDEEEENRLLHSGLDDSNHLYQSHHPSRSHDFGGQSSLFGDDDGVLDYALEHGLIDSRYGGAGDTHSSPPSNSMTSARDGAHSSYEVQQPHPPLSATAPALRSSTPEISGVDHHRVSASQPNPSTELTNSTDNLDTAKHAVVDTTRHAMPEERRDSNSSSGSSPLVEDLAQSKLFTHDEAESMYMSAMSAAPMEESPPAVVPGGWDSASSSSEGTAPDMPISFPPTMIASTILDTTTEGEEGCETPRPGSPASTHSAQLKPIPSPGNISATERQSFQAEKAEPAGSTFSDNAKVSKPFLSIDSITIWFPLNLSGDESSTGTNVSPAADEPQVQFQAAADLGDDSIFQDMPGSFSFYAESTAPRRRKGSSEAAETWKRNANPKPVKGDAIAKTPTARLDQDCGIEVEVGTICGQIDISAGHMMFQMAQKLMAALGASAGETQKTQNPQKASNVEAKSSLRLSIRHTAFVWLERLATDSVMEGRHPCTPFKLEENPSDAILKMNMHGLQISARTNAKESTAKMHIDKFNLSCLDQEVITFDSGARSRRSIRDTGEQLEHDVHVEFQQSAERRLHIITRPIKLLFDVQKLDEALGSFGGFSGVLELGNSITSNNTLHGSPSPPVQPRSRGVHFEHPPPPPPPPPAVDSSSSQPLKVNIRFGDVSFLLKGKSCAVNVQTSPVKMIIRESNFGLQITDIRISGPYTNFPRDHPAFVTEIKDFNVRFLFTPEEVDLTRLLSIITPSKDKYENDSDILIDTLLRQRRKGSVIRVAIASLSINVSDVDRLRLFQDLGIEMARLSTVTKYLPEDDRPGILTLASIKQFDANVMVNERIGNIELICQASQFAHVGLPPLFAMEIGKIALNREDETLVDEVVSLQPLDQLPMIMARMIGDEMEPTIKAKLFNVCLEYRVSTIMDVLGLADSGTTDGIVSGIASSVATITGPSSPKSLSRQSSGSSSSSSAAFKPLRVDLLLRDCALGLNPRKMPSKGLFVLTDTRLSGALPKKHDFSAVLELRKASILVIDDVNRIGDPVDSSSQSTPVSTFGGRQLANLRQSGFVSLGQISSAKASVKITGNGDGQPQIVDVEFKNDLLVLETCADSTATLKDILNGLQPPTPPSTAQKYRTVVPLQEMMESFSGDAFATIPTEEDGGTFTMDDADHVDDEVPNNLEYVGSFYNPESIPTEEDVGDSILGEDDLHSLASPPITRQRGGRALLESFQEQYEVAPGEQEFDFNDNYFGVDSEVKGTARKWDSTKNQYQLSNEFKSPGSPLKVRMRDMHIIWNLFDGYDWPKTRDVITKAVEKVENQAEERRHRRASADDDEDEYPLEEDFLFNSVWISVPVNEERGALAKKINHDVDDLVSETGSYATTTASRSTARQKTSPRTRRRRLKLERSKHHKITFELRGVAVDLVVFPPSEGETQSSANIRVHDFEIFDHIATSTWRKFATSQQDPKEREMGRPMITLEFLTVKPTPDLAASELVLKVTVLPLRLHVDQDALDFITRFFEFKDESAASSTGKEEQPFLQRVEVDTVKIKLDYKPKKIDYAGLRSGHTTEFMNFFILDGSDINLRHAILYGIKSFDELHHTLNDVWMPDVKRHQLPGVLAGLAPVRSIVNVGSGVRDLVVVPMREYKKDGRIMRSIQKGVYAFGRNTTTELARLGAKIAIGTQNVLEGAENLLSPHAASPGSSSGFAGWEDIEPSHSPGSFEEPRAISNYANQPIGVMAGLRGAARHLERDLLTARDAVIAIPGEAMESGSAGGAARALMRRAPIVILKPLLGGTKAVSNTLLGVSNALDPQSRRKIEDKYKSY